VLLLVRNVSFVAKRELFYCAYIVTVKFMPDTFPLDRLKEAFELVASASARGSINWIDKAYDYLFSEV
jgi:hypothetical protein